MGTLVTGWSINRHIQRNRLLRARLLGNKSVRRIVNKEYDMNCKSIRYYGCLLLAILAFAIGMPASVLAAPAASHAVSPEVNGFYYYFDTLYLSPDVTVPVSFGLRGKFPAHAHFSLIVNVPQGVQLSSASTPKPITLHGRPYTQYVYLSHRTSNYYTAIKVTASVSSSVHNPPPVVYYAKWDGGEQPHRTLPLRIVSIAPTPRLKHIRVGLEMNYRGMVDHYHRLGPSFKRAGLNYVAAGIAAWTLGCKPRQPDGAYRKFINKIEKAGITVSTGNIGAPFNQYKRVIKHKYGAYKLAGTLYHPKTQFKKFEVKDFMAEDIHGKKIDAMCPSYRGRYFKKVLDNVKLLIDYGYTNLLYDEETWGMPYSVKSLSTMPPQICYGPRCRAKFAKFRAKYYPKLKTIDPRVFAAAPKKYPKLVDAYWDFQTSMVADIYQHIKQVAVKYGGPKIKVQAYVAAGIWGGKRYAAIFHRMTDYRKVAKGLDAMFPMVYTTSLKNSARVGKVAGFLWKQVHGLAKPCMALSPARTYEYKRVVNHKYPPAIAIKYQMFEAFSQGCQGIIIWSPYSSLEGALSFKYIAQAVRAVAPVEDVIIHGKLIKDPLTSNSRVHAQGITYQHRTVILVADYTSGKVTTDITYKVNAPRSVVDLETHKVVGHLTPSQNTFNVTLNQRRALLFVVK